MRSQDWRAGMLSNQAYDAWLGGRGRARGGDTPYNPRFIGDEGSLEETGCWATARGEPKGGSQH